MIQRRSARRGLFSPYRIVLGTIIVCTAILFLNLLRLHEKVTGSEEDITTTSSGDPIVSPHYSKRQRASCTRDTIRTYQDLKRCTPSKRFTKLDPFACDRVETWDSVQHCLNRRFTTAEESSLGGRYEIHIIGERNSGTKFIMRELQQCFPNNDFNVRVHRDFIRTKHFFQPISSQVGRRDYRRSIVISIFRDPVEWTAAMIQKPYHSPNHVAGFDNVTHDAIPLPWTEFVSRRWKTARSNFDLELINTGRIDETNNGLICKDHFSFKEVVPCQYDYNTSTTIPQDRLRGYDPIYELKRDGTGQSFENILEMRSDKIFNFVFEIPLLLKLGGYAAVRYEDLLRNGTEFLMLQIAEIIGLDGLPASCKPTPPQPQRLGKRLVPEGLRQWVNEHMDVERERLIGYRD